MKKTILAVVLLAGAAMINPASAAEITITDVTGTWIDVNPNGVATGIGSPDIRWGTPAGGNGQSGYSFVGATGGPFGVGSNFSLGTFSHINQPITGDTITQATLALSITFTSDLFIGSKVSNSLFVFNHNETPNTCNCSPGDDDIVTAVTNLGGSSTFSLSGIDYIFAFTGFQRNDLNFAQFSSPEGQTNTATLRGSFVDVRQVAVPGPVVGAGIPGLLAALGSGGFGWRRRYHQMFA